MEEGHNDPRSDGGGSEREIGLEEGEFLIRTEKWLVVVGHAIRGHVGIE